MKTVKQRNMVNREMKLAIGDKLQTLFHPIVNATKQAAEETRKELAPMKKALTVMSQGLGLRSASRMGVRAENGLKVEGTTLRYRRLSPTKSELEPAVYTYYSPPPPPPPPPPPTHTIVYNLWSCIKRNPDVK